MNNRNNNKRSSIQKVDPKVKVSDDNSTTSKKGFSSKSFINIVFNEYKILAYSILIIVPSSFVIGALSFWIYYSNLKQDQLLARLSNQLETMPTPISQGRLGLIIKKSNDGLMLEINKEILSLNEKIQKIENLINSFPKPISEGKIGLILDKKIKKISGDLEKKLTQEIENLINSFPKPVSEGKIGLILDKKIKKISGDLEKKLTQNFSSKNNFSSISKQNEEMISKVNVEFKKLKLSLENITKIIGTEEIEGSLTQEIIQLKSQRNNKFLQTSSLAIEEDDQIKSIEVAEDLSLIIRQFPDFAYKAIKEDLKVNRKDGLINSVINNFQLIFVKRSLTPQEGDTVDSILSRAEYALNNKNYDKLFEELNKLPKEASLVMDEWRKIFEGYLENNS